MRPQNALLLDCRGNRDALTTACAQRGYPEGLVFNPGRCVQHASGSIFPSLHRPSLVASIGRTDACYNNVSMEPVLVGSQAPADIAN